MSCTYWLSKNAQCGKASPSASIGKTLALCELHASLLRMGLSRFVGGLSFAAREWTVVEMLDRLGYKEAA